jgi:deoxyadenosine/deoxycytidine kinase
MFKYQPLLWLEGVLGAGKTTFAKEIAKRLDLRLIEEPVGNGEGISNPYLGLFYQKPKKYAFGMQMFLLHTRYAMQQLASFEATGVGGYKGAILDRSISGDRVFAKMLMEDGAIEPIDFATYEMAYHIMCRTLLPPTLLVFLEVTPETAFARMQKRNRSVEAGVPLAYLQRLQLGYEELIAEAEKGLLPWSHAVKVCRVPWDQDTLTSEQWDETAAMIASTCREKLA